MNSSKTKLGTRDRGFSLVEVSMAIGLLSFSLLAMIGLLPGGMQTLRESMDCTTHALIVQSIAEELNVSDLDSEMEFALYFDTSAQRVAADAARFEVTVREEPPSLPGLEDAALQELHGHLKRIRIEIKLKDAPSVRPSSYAIQVASR